MLQALGATVTLVSAAGRREIPVGDLYANDGMRYLTRRPDEIMASVAIPNSSGWRSAYWKLRRRGSFDFPVASAAVAAQLDGSRVTSIRIVLGAVASRPLEAARAMELLFNEPLSDELIEQAAAAAGDVAKPMDNTDFELVWRKRMVRALVTNALKEVRGDDMRAERKRLARMALLSVTEPQA
jgi:CO/xanthine dehydrogenase FAD-binding subunit